MKQELKDRLVSIDFPEEQYKPEVYEKTQIVIHHTASGIGVKGDIKYWKSTPSAIATAVLIGHDGKIHQAFSSKKWAYHLGIKGSVFKEHNVAYQNLNKSSIGIEIDSWGQLLEIDGKYYSWAGTEVSADRVQTYAKPFKEIPQSAFFEDKMAVGRPCYHYEKYTEEQIAATKLLLEYWCERYDLPKCYNEDMWDVSANALNGSKGVWTHVSYRVDKADCHPQPELKHMLQNLE